MKIRHFLVVHLPDAGNFKTRLESEFILPYFSLKQNVSNLNQTLLKGLTFFF